MNRLARIFFCCTLSLATLGAAAALTVSVCPAEGDVAAAERDVAPPLESLVSGCLDSLFDSGLIATTAPSAVLDPARWQDSTYGIAGAKEGFIDFVFTFYVTWRSSAIKKHVWLVATCSYRLIRIADGATVASGAIDSEPDSPEAAADPEQGARSEGVLLGNACVQWLRKSSNGGEG